MGKTITATNAARNFSALLNKVGFRGEHYTIARGGKAIAYLAPAAVPVTRVLGELPDLLRKLPSLGKDAAPFARAVRSGVRKAPGLPRKGPWA